MLASAGDRTTWQTQPCDPARAQELAEALGIGPLTAQLLINRRVVAPEEARRFLEPRLSDLRPPADPRWPMAGFDRAVERIAAALGRGETIGIFGDYDVDGVTTAALLGHFLREVGGKVVVRAARRDAGYGFGPESAEEFAAAGCALVITCDCGTSDHEGLGRARELGSDTIVVDHHQAPEGDPGAYALINPHQPACCFPFKGMASVGVGFYLAAAVRTRWCANGRDAPDPRGLLDLVAVGTVADLVPLTEENRILVAAGLRELERGRRPGLRALAEVAGLWSGGRYLRPPTTVDIGFKFGPLLNAPGRLGDAQQALDLLLAGEATASAQAQRCGELNVRRRELQEQVAVAAFAQAETVSGSHSTVVAGEGWPAGVVGIVAAKLVERFHRPSLVIAWDGAVGRGSARTPPGIDLHRALTVCRSHLVRFGGHAMAAGITIDREAIEPFRRAFDDAVEQQGSEALGQRSLLVDAEVQLEQLTERQVEELHRLAPFGNGNPEPLLGARGLAVAETRVVGQHHLQLSFYSGSERRNGIAFGFADRNPGVGARVGAAFVPEIDLFRGTRRLRLRVRELVAEG